MTIGACCFRWLGFVFAGWILAVENGAPEVNAFKSLPEHKVSFDDQLIRVYGDMAINSGYYTFSYKKDGESKTLPARYSFVYAKRNGQWMIVDHHSSAMPAVPK